VDESARIGSVVSVTKAYDKRFVTVIDMSGLVDGTAGSTITWIEEKIEPWMVPGTIVVVSIIKGPQPSV
jgi:hypothetical protein